MDGIRVCLELVWLISMYILNQYGWYQSMSRTSMADINVYLKLVWMVKNESDGHEQ